MRKKIKSVEYRKCKNHFVQGRSKRLIIILLAAAMISNQSIAYAGAAGGDSEISDETRLKLAELPAADIFNVDFSIGADDQSQLQNQLLQTTGSPEIAKDRELNKNTASFNGRSTYTYSFGQGCHDKIRQNLTMECMVKFKDIQSGEHDFFSNQESGGIGLGLNNGMLTFFAHVDGSYRQPEAEVSANQWYHIAGVIDGKEVKLYVNGELKAVNTDAWNSGIQFPSSTDAWNMVLGGDITADGNVDFLSNVDIGFARIYSDALSDKQISIMNEKAFEGTSVTPGGPINLGLIGSSGIAENASWNLNIHGNKNKSNDIDKIEYDIVYDNTLMEYESVQRLKDGVTITEEESGRLHVVSEMDLSTESFHNYSATRMGKLNFKIKDISDSVTSTISTENFKAYSWGTDVTENLEILPNAEKELSLYAENMLDINEDGVIGAGDVALAEGNLKAAAAGEAAIYPYKHAVILTMDGSGNVWDPDAVYYAPNNDVLPAKHTDTETMSKRKNTYAMKLMNEEFATSYTAQSTVPSISAQNYFSILHGIPWMDVPVDYQIDNDLANVYYYTDYGRETPLYPSVFKAAQAAFPERQNAAFTEWAEILDGIIEPDAPVTCSVSESQRSFYDVADYIRSKEYKNTAVVYMQNDWMDHVGHGSGYYSDVFWDELQQYDDQYKAVIDALKESGEYDETLIVTNADHGGSGYGHGSLDPSNMDIFLGVGGQTVQSGRRLQGGTNSDISPIVLSALRMEVPQSMTGKVFDENMFLTQEEMSKKNRDIEKVVLERGKSTAVLSLENQKSETRAIDAVIELNGAEVTDVRTDCGTILRQETVDGKLKLTISYDSQPERLAEITCQSAGDSQLVLEEIMLGTESGKEIYPDLLNTEENDDPEPPVSADLNSLKLAVDMAEKLEAEQKENKSFTDESWIRVQQALDHARGVMENPKAAQADVDEAFLNLITVCNLLEGGVQKAGLKAAIEGTKAILGDEAVLAGYTKESVETVRTALAEAEKVLAETSADAQTVNDASRKLMDAVTCLLVKNQGTRLDILIQKAQELLNYKDQYTPSSVLILEQSLEAAKAVAGNNHAADEEINSAYEKLAEAMTLLVRKAGKEELKNALEKANEILENGEKYLEESIAGLQAVTDEAQEVFDNGEADSVAVGEVLKKLVNEILKARLMGDVDMNGKVETVDSSKVLKSVAELAELTEEQHKVADVNGDGNSDSTDAAAILQYAAEKISEF